MKLPIFLACLGICVAAAVVLGVTNGFSAGAIIAFAVATCVAVQLVYFAFIIGMAVFPRKSSEESDVAMPELSGSEFTLPELNTTRDT